MAVDDGVTAVALLNICSVAIDDLRFRNGVDNLRAGLVFVQTGEARLPLVVAVQHHGLAGVHVVRIQLDDHFLRTLAVLVVVVVPGLDHIYIHLAGGVAVLDVIAGHHSGVATHLFLGDGVDDLFAAGILVEVGEAPLPAIFRRHGLAVNLLSVGQQIDGDILRALAILVVIVVPGLAARNFSDLLRHMGIGHNEAIFHGTGDVGIIVRNTQLCNRVCDRFAVFILGQIGEAALPVVLRVQRERLVGRLIVGHQFHSHARRALAVLIPGVLPLLADADLFDRFDLMGVGDVVAVNNALVVLHILFFDGVVDLVTVGVILVPGKAPLPAIFRRHDLTVNYLAIDQQIDDDLLRAHIVAIAVVIPGLVAGNGDLLGVGHNKAFSSRTGDVGFVVRNILLNNRVYDIRLRVIVVRPPGQAGEAALPIVLRSQRQFLAGFYAVGQQLHGHAVRALAVLFVEILPLLADRHADVL